MYSCSLAVSMSSPVAPKILVCLIIDSSYATACATYYLTSSASAKKSSDSASMPLFYTIFDSSAGTSVACSDSYVSFTKLCSTEVIEFSTSIGWIADILTIL